MKFDCGLSLEQRILRNEERLEKWHRWFAWHPVRVGLRDCRWLEHVERKGRRLRTPHGSRWDWSYRPEEESE